MRASYAVLGLGTFGIEIIKELINYDVDIIGVDILKENAIKAGKYIKNVYITDITDFEALKELGIDNVDCAIVSIGKNIPQTILATINLDQLKIKNIIVRIDDEMYASVITKLGASKVVIPQGDAAKILVHQLIHSEFDKIIKIARNYGVVNITLNSSLDIKNLEKVKVLLVMRSEEYFIPAHDEILQPMDELYVFGSIDDLSNFQKEIRNV